MRRALTHAEWLDRLGHPSVTVEATETVAVVVPLPSSEIAWTDIKAKYIQGRTRTERRGPSKMVAR